MRQRTQQRQLYAIVSRSNCWIPGHSCNHSLYPYLDLDWTKVGETDPFAKGPFVLSEP